MFDSLNALVWVPPKNRDGDTEVVIPILFLIGFNFPELLEQADSCWFAGSRVAEREQTLAELARVSMELSTAAGAGIPSGLSGYGAQHRKGPYNKQIMTFVPRISKE